MREKDSRSKFGKESKLTGTQTCGIKYTRGEVFEKIVVIFTSVCAGICIGGL